jgi:uncharacterized protein (TIGR02246 family)
MATSGKFRALQQSMWAPFIELIRPRKSVEVLEKRIRYLEQETAIRDVLNRYTYAYDASDVETLKTVFHPDCVVVNPRGTYRGRDLIESNYKYLIASRRFSFHFAMNATVRIDDSEQEAGMVAYFQDISFLPSGGIKASGGTYVFRLVQTDGEWQFIEMRITNNYQHRLAADSASDTGASLAPTDRAPAPSTPENTREWVGPGALA